MNKEDIVAIVVAVLVALPVLAISARIGLKPLVDAVLKLYSAARSEFAALEAQRVAQLESELEVLRSEVHRLRQIEDFQRGLETGPSSGQPNAESRGRDRDPATVLPHVADEDDVPRAGE